MALQLAPIPTRSPGDEPRPQGDAPPAPRPAAAVPVAGPLPTVSVILPVFNRADSVARAVDSVLAQGYPALELLVVDDGSTDGTRAALRAYGSRLEVIVQPNQGAYAARNAALRRARGELIAFIDSDDVWLPDRLVRQLPLLADPEVGMVFGNAAIADRRSDPGRLPGRTTFDITPPGPARAADFAHGCFVPFSTVLVRRECFARCGEFDGSARLGADYLKWFQIALRYRLAYVPEPVAVYTLHAGNISADVVRAVSCRLALFRAELDHVADAGTRRQISRILVGLHLALAWAFLRRGEWRPILPLGPSFARCSGANPVRALTWTAELASRRLVARWRGQPRRPRPAPTGPIAV